MNSSSQTLEDAEQQAEKARALNRERIRASKRPDTHLSMVAHSGNPTHIFGKSFIFSYSPLHLMLIAFTFGYINSFTLLKFGVFSTMVTGNALNCEYFRLKNL